MAKRKGFRDWMEEDEWGEQSQKFAKKDPKRYDKKKSHIQKARRQKRKAKDSFFDS